MLDVRLTDKFQLQRNESERAVDVSAASASARTMTRLAAATLLAWATQSPSARDCLDEQPNHNDGYLGLRHGGNCADAEDNIDPVCSNNSTRSGQITGAQANVREVHGGQQEEPQTGASKPNGVGRPHAVQPRR